MACWDMQGHIRRGGGMLGYAGAHEVVVCWDTQGHIRRGGGMLGYAGAHKERWWHGATSWYVLEM